MKRVWRFLKWCFAGMSWFEWYMLGIMFCLGGGFFATMINDTQLRNFWFGLLIILIALAIVTFMIKGIISVWNKFKEEDEKVFNILKQEEIK